MYLGTTKSSQNPSFSVAIIYISLLITAVKERKKGNKKNPKGKKKRKIKKWGVISMNK